MEYYLFVLGYDLLHDVLGGIECDIAYDICEQVYKDFEKSEYKSLNVSVYVGLLKYIEANKDEIKRKVEEEIM